MKSLLKKICLLGWLASIASSAVGFEMPSYMPPPWDRIMTDTVPAPPPLLLRLRGLSAEEVDLFRRGPGVESVEVEGEWWKVVWQPNLAGPWGKTEGKRLPDTIGDFHKLLAIKRPLGKTRWDFSGRSLPTTRIIPAVGSEETRIDFVDTRAGGVRELRIYHAPWSPPGLIMHEMMRKVIGNPYEVCQIGDAYVIVGKQSDSVRVTWLVSQQCAIYITDSFDKEMIAGYLNRFGSITPKEFRLEFDDWMQTEIWWRLYWTKKHWDSIAKSPLDQRLQRWAAFDGQELYQWTDIATRLKSILEDDPIEKKYAWIIQARRYLWANRENFSRGPDRHAFVLRGPDRYDPAHPPEMPPEIADPPPPPGVPVFTVPEPQGKP